MYDGSGTPDVLSYSRGSQVHDNFYENFDPYQGTVVVTRLVPEWAHDNTDTHRLADVGTAWNDLKLIDTAGLDEKLPPEQDAVERAAQKSSIRILERANLVLLVLDNSQPAEELDEKLLEKIADKKIITVLNKSDLPPKLDVSRLPEALSNTAQISAKEGTGIENLAEKIRQISGTADFDLRTAVCFTDRQENLLQQLRHAKSKQQAAAIITELLNGRLCV